jgi:hypothetical protein
MYLNAGSTDIGPDPDWDKVNRRWKGYDNRQRKEMEKLNSDFSDEQNQKK